MFLGLAEDVLESPLARRLKGRVKLIFTSPPFPLNRKKKYGNLEGRQYLLWLSGFADVLSPLLHPKGSIVIEIGNAWEPGSPTFSTLPMQSLLEFKEAGGFHLCQEFIYYNPAKLPTPAQWVTIDRERVKDAFSRLWWMSPSPHPDAKNVRVLLPYSEDMRKLLSTRKYNAGTRPSEHQIGPKSFLKDNGGSIPSNVLTAANTAASDPYLQFCRKKGLEFHPARMPPEVARFFITFLTKPGDLVMDPFGGSNVTGAVAEALGRRWMSIEPNIAYARGSIGRFQKVTMGTRRNRTGPTGGRRERGR
jgi:site-specific DNA-methyltransferase (cytosine-N4-specific)